MPSATKTHAPAMAMAHAALDTWARAVDIESRLPRVGAWTAWWRLRYLLVHEHLPALFADTPHPHSALHPIPRVAARLFKAAVGEARLRRALATPPARPRILVISRANAWDGHRDRELASVLSSLEASGVECLVMEQSHGPLAAQLHGWRTRPSTHLLGDVIHLRYRAGRRPAFPPPGPAPDAPLPIAGRDYAAEVWHFIQQQCLHQTHEHNAYLSVMPPILQQLGVRALLLTDENGAGHGMKMAAAAAGIPVVAVQHGCIHGDHLNYIFPRETAPEAVPLATRTCLYGEHERALLLQHSCYREESLVVTGQVQNDARTIGLRPWGQRGETGAALRARTLPSENHRLLLLTSQDLLHQLAAERLLPRLKDAPPEWHLVIRPHPRENGPHWTHYLQEHGITHRATIAAEGSLEDWLDACDVHASVSSTVLSEAVLWGRPNIVLGLDAVGDWLGVVHAGLANDLSKMYSLEEALTPAPDIEARRQHYISHHFHTLDGQAGPRIAETILGLIT